MSDTFAWAIHYDDGKKHPQQPGGVTSGIVVMGITQSACRVILAQFKDPIDLTKCHMGCVWKDEFIEQVYHYEPEQNNSNETD
jgi:hypothetical protein